MSFPLQYEKPRKLISYLLTKGLDTTVGFIRNCAELPFFKDYYRECPKTRKLESEILHIPVYPSLSDTQIEYIADSIKGYFP